jgi:hypothetical protein
VYGVAARQLYDRRRIGVVLRGDDDHDLMINQQSAIKNQQSKMAARTIADC